MQSREHRTHMLPLQYQILTACSSTLCSKQREANGATTPKQASSGTQNTNLRSMSDTRKAKFKRLLEQQVLASETHDSWQNMSLVLGFAQ